MKLVYQSEPKNDYLERLKETIIIVIQTIITDKDVTGISCLRNCVSRFQRRKTLLQGWSGSAFTGYPQRTWAVPPSGYWNGAASLQLSKSQGRWECNGRGVGWSWPPHAESWPPYSPPWPDPNHPCNHRITAVTTCRRVDNFRHCDGTTRHFRCVHILSEPPPPRLEESATRGRTVQRGQTGYGGSLQSLKECSSDGVSAARHPPTRDGRGRRRSASSCWSRGLRGVQRGTAGGRGLLLAWIDSKQCFPYIDETVAVRHSWHK